ncbi:AtpZ/AtpI family protein [Gilvibacter sediminis]|uniref:AtpZ/AtpI family protein n=1 Tax=Gilvibacter sediminis TaxID=379071 RepID=UPI002350F091|nr:AtpZ/AtpI family protein [Gilvibacter sediminis]MDC7996767.1 AtpZ/AtpI family protein [Gilvibacter sediminis]
MPKEKRNGALKNWAVFSSIGLQMGLIIWLGNLLGSWLDSKFNTTFLETTITLVAIFASMFSVIHRVNRFNKDN